MLRPPPRSPPFPTRRSSDLMAAMAGFHATLTLPGIAGIVLTIGMAVDTNILIFERIREELRGGKTVRASIDAGFARARSEEHTSELQSRRDLVCRLLLEKKK